MGGGRSREVVAHGGSTVFKSQSPYDPHIEFCPQNGFRS